MNDLAIRSTSVIQGFHQLREANRLKYPYAYYSRRREEKAFELGSYLVNYCNDGNWIKEDQPDWIASFIEQPSVLAPNMKRKVYSGEYIGFFGLPRNVQEGLLIYIHEKFWGEESRFSIFDFDEYHTDLVNAAMTVVGHMVHLHEEVNGITDEDEDAYDERIDQIVADWTNDLYSWGGSGGWTLFFDADEEITLFCQLAACMGYEFYLYPGHWSSLELAPADVMLEGMATWEGKSGIGMTFQGKEFDHTDTVITVNAAQSVVTGNTYLAEYMEKIFNQSPWGIWLKEVMEDFKEFFPLRKEKIRINAYAQIDGSAK